MPIIALPTQLDFMRWTSQLRLDLINYTVPIPQSQNEWRFWAAQFLQQNPTLQNIPTPTINSYPNPDDWRKWAIAMTAVITQQ